MSPQPSIQASSQNEETERRVRSMRLALQAAASAIIEVLDLLDGDVDEEITCEDEGAQCDDEGWRPGNGLL